jgi:hypothetical protein
LIGLFRQIKGTIAGNAISFRELPGMGSARRYLRKKNATAAAVPQSPDPKRSAPAEAATERQNK